MKSAETKNVIMQEIMKQGLSDQGANRRTNLHLSRDISRQIAYQEVIPFDIYCRSGNVRDFYFLRSESDVTAPVIVAVIFATARLRCFVLLKDLM